MMEKVLENRIAIITGASQGLGFETAKKYVEAGASLAICARNKTKLAEAKKQLQSMLNRVKKFLP